MTIRERLTLLFGKPWYPGALPWPRGFMCQPGQMVSLELYAETGQRFHWLGKVKRGGAIEWERVGKLVTHDASVPASGET